jgi:hypothetical protein
MKKLITIKRIILTLALVAAGPMTVFGQNGLEKDPAYLPIEKYLDLKAIPPQVNVNLPRFLLKDAISDLSTNDAFAKNGIDLPDLVKDVKLIRVVVIQGGKSNRDELEKGVKKLRAELDAKWTPIVTVTEGNNVGIYAKGDPLGESMAGVAVLVFDGSDLVIGNVVGHVSIAKLLTVAMKSKQFPKDFLKNLSVGAERSTPKPAEKADKGDEGAKANAPAEAPEPAPKDPAKE